MDRIALEIVAKAEIAEHFEERVMAGRIADVLEIVVLAPARTQRCDVVARTYGRFSTPRNTSLNWTMPEFTNSSVGSLAGTSDDEGTIVCPRSAKNCRNLVRISAAFMAIRVRSCRVGAMDGRRYAAKLLILRGLRRSCQRAEATGEPPDAIIMT
jgi:hypothetical protein